MSSAYAILVVGAGMAANLLLAAMSAARVRAPGRARALGFAGTAMAMTHEQAHIRGELNSEYLRESALGW